MNTLHFPIVYMVSDNFEGYLTKPAYMELCLQMSTGDFHMHTCADVLRVSPFNTEDVYDYDHELQDLIEIGQIKDFIKGESK